MSYDPNVPPGNTPPGPSGGPPYGSPIPAGTAGLGARIGARLLDVLLVGIPAGLILGLIGLGAGFTGDGWIGSAIVSVLWFGYFVLLESNRGATLGKSLLNLRVVVADGSNPPTDVAAKRNIWMLFGLIPVLGGLLSFVAVIVIIVTIVSDQNNRGYHDQFAGTAVMRT
ncbi:RDD family protein [Egicoccus sp. AB-alg2]|uniref:RDD family protein n=1 Tax=Egicoccus sp. AB-alg2 TaxID=3242693 RepID=UPI00359DBE86